MPEVLEDWKIHSSNEKLSGSDCTVVRRSYVCRYTMERKCPIAQMSF